MNALLGFVIGPLRWAYEWIESSTHIFDDLYIVSGLIYWGIQYFLGVATNSNSFYNLFESSARKYPDHLALVYARPGSQDGQFSVDRFTYSQLQSLIRKMSWMLVNEYGVTQDDIVALDCTNGPLFVVVWFALWNIGATPAFLNYNVTGKSLFHCLNVVSARLVLVESELADAFAAEEAQLKSALPQCRVRYLPKDVTLFEKLASYPELRVRPSERRTDRHYYDPSLLIYTSGTTGLPKSAIMSWQKATLGSALFGHVNRIKHGETIYTSMPLYHSTSSVLGVLPCFAAGATVALGKKFSVSTFWKQVKITDATFIQYVGEVCRYLLAAPKTPEERDHKVWVAFGNGLRKEIWTEFKDRFGIKAIGEFYAATEAPIGTTCFQTGDYGVGAIRKYGKLINFVLSFEQTVVAMDPDDDSEVWRDPRTGLCRQARVDEPGEFLMRLFTPREPQKSFQGYVGNEKETEHKIVRNVYKKGDAYFRTGDLLKMDKDGLLYFVDRLGDTFRWKSENVSTNEVESIICESEPVAQAVVVGVQITGYEGRAGFSVIELKPSAVGDPLGCLNGKVLPHMVENLPKYAVPLFVKFVPEIASSHNFKIVKKQYKNQVFPKGANNNETIYWLNRGHYEELTPEVWSGILNKRIRL